MEPTEKSVWPAIKKWSIQLALAIVVAALAALFTWLGVKVDLPQTPVVTEQKPAAEAIQEPLYFCGRVEAVTDGFVSRPWPDRKITWHVDTSGTTLPREQLVEAFRAAWASWAAHIDILPVFVEDASEALVRSRFGDYDGSGKVLAWSELADGTRTPKHQLYDRAEKWGVFSGSGVGVDLARVAAHEIGHVLGLFHDEGKGDALMDPVYSRVLRFPTDKDVQRALKMGYKIAKKSEPDPMPGGIELSFPVKANANDVAEALRKAGFKVEPPKP